MAAGAEEWQAWAYEDVRKGVENSLKLITRKTPSWVHNPPRGRQAVEVLCAGINPVDFKLPESWIESSVAWFPKPATPGLDFCGRLVAQPDRLVFGRLGWPAQYGTLGRYILVEDNDFTDVPTGCSVEEAAGVPIAGLTAYQSIVPYVKKGDRVMIFGGSGGVGTFSIQIAKLLGCHVTATCSARNEQLCRDLGADMTIDYTETDVVQALAALPAFNLAVDNIGNDPTLHRRSQAFLKPDGRFVLVSGMLESIAGLLSMAESIARPWWLGGPPTKFTLILCQANKKHLEQIAGWVADGKVKVVVDTVYEYEEAPKALAKIRTGRARGKIVVRVVGKA